jgi:hypothetical protein
MPPKRMSVQQARARVEQLQRELDSYAAKQHNVRVDLIEQDPKYKEINTRLLRAKAVLRSVKRP